MSPASIEQFVLEDGSVTQETWQPPDQTTIPYRGTRGFTWSLILTSLLSSALLFGFDQTVTTDIQQDIVTSFDSFGELHWISLPFLLGAIASRFVWIKLYSNFNVKNLYLAAITIFALGSTLCAASPIMSVLIVGRTVCGTGGSGMYIGAMKLLSQTTNDKERSRLLGIPSLVWGLATVLGPIVGDAFTFTIVGWRFAFYFNLVACAIFTPILFKLPSISTMEQPRPTSPLVIFRFFRENDPLGTTLLGVIYVTGIIATSLGGIIYDWTDGKILFLFAVCGCFIVMYSIQQILHLNTFGTPPNPDSAISYKSKMVVFLFVAESSASASFFVTVYFVPLYFQFLNGSSVLSSSVHLLPLLASILLMVPISEAATARRGNSDVVQWFFGFGGLLIFVGGVLIATVDGTGLDDSLVSTHIRIYSATILIGVGAGVYIQLPFTTLPPENPPGRSVDFVSYAQLAAPAVVLAFADTFYNDNTTACLLNLLPSFPVVVLQQLVAGGSINFVDASNESTREMVKGCVGSSIRKVFILVAGTGGLTVATTLLMTSMRVWPSSRKKETSL